tara:strand:- start:447 stop:881 length:435 start_codon:yes stop_codon:yes gene_type:complete
MNTQNNDQKSPGFSVFSNRKSSPANSDSVDESIKQLSVQRRNRQFNLPSSLQKQNKDVINEVSSRFEQHSSSTPVKTPKKDAEFTNSIVPGNHDKAKFESPPNSDKDQLRLRLKTEGIAAEKSDSPPLRQTKYALTDTKQTYSE